MFNPRDVQGLWRSPLSTITRGGVTKIYPRNPGSFSLAGALRLADRGEGGRCSSVSPEFLLIR